MFSVLSYAYQVLSTSVPLSITTKSQVNEVTAYNPEQIINPLGSSRRSSFLYIIYTQALFLM